MSSNIYLPHPSLSVYVCFSSISLTRRPIIGSTTERQPAAPFARKAFSVRYIRASYSFPRQICARTHNTLGKSHFQCTRPMATGGQIQKKKRLVFYRFLVNNSNFFVIFMPMLPKNISPINI